VSQASYSECLPWKPDGPIQKQCSKAKQQDVGHESITIGEEESAQGRQNGEDEWGRVPVRRLIVVLVRKAESWEYKIGRRRSDRLTRLIEAFER